MTNLFQLLRCGSLSVLAGVSVLAGTPSRAQINGAASPAAGESSRQDQRLTPRDLSTIRGANYRGSAAADTTDYWIHYNPAETERDMGYADRLALNQLRVFVNYASWNTNKSAFRTNLLDLARACNRHKLGLMITIGDTQAFLSNDSGQMFDSGVIRDFVADLAQTIRKEPALAFWDASNEPDLNPNLAGKRFEIARLISATLHDQDPQTPVTIGVAFERSMETLANAVDVLSFHDYLPTRIAIRKDIERAKAFAAKSGKQVMDTEIGCVARASPYDVTLQEHMNAHVGWYMWELMITRRWGNVHGVFYPDGSVRDPSIPAAMFGFFRNRGPDVVLEAPDRENRLSQAITDAKRWVDAPDATWDQGLDFAETLANFLESAQLVAMHEPPTRTIALMRNRPPNIPALRDAMQKYLQLLAPYQNPAPPR